MDYSAAEAGDDEDADTGEIRWAAYTGMLHVTAWI